VNVFGSFIIGFFATLTGPDGRVMASTETRQFVMVGICGGYTTFSSFSLQTLETGARRPDATRRRQYRPLRRFMSAGGVAETHRGSLAQQNEGSMMMQTPLYEAIVLKAREVQLAGATILRGPMGFGHSSRLHTAKILRLSEHLPIVIEIVDSEEKITAFLPHLDEMMSSGLVTLDKVQVLQYGKSKQ
jgi:PII-like signaling protein